MNENIDLTKILKDCPIGTKLYSPVFGDVEFVRACQNDSVDFPIEFKLSDDSLNNVTTDGRLYEEFNGECILFPSKDQRDWSKFKAPWLKKKKFDPKTFKPFDRVLARIDGGDTYCWFADFVSIPMIEKYDILPCIMSNKDVEMIIPYNEDTKHLVGTTDEAPEYYSYWEE